jgi:predicted P-loop ATPase
MIDSSAFAGAARDLQEVPARPGKATPDWRKWLILNTSDAPRAILANVLTALRGAPELHGALAFNEFAVRVETKRDLPWGKKSGELWTDNDDRLTAEWLQKHDIFVNTNLAGEGVQTVAAERKFHPVRDYLTALEWDGVERLDRLAVDYLGAADKGITRMFARRWMISGVARVFRPGAKADCCLVLEGRQGIGKSTFLKILGGDWFTDQLADLGSKDASMQCHGVWIIEIAELDAMNRSESSRTKAFMSQTFDRFRLPYAKNLVNWGRDCVFAGTSNHDAYLRDETGARRFWPVRCGQIDIAATTRDRDQLWAEAVALYRKGEIWWLEEAAEIRHAEAEQAERYQAGAWDDSIAAWLKNPTERFDHQGHPVGAFSSDLDSVTIHDILLHRIGKEMKQWTRADEMAVSAALKALEWERFRQRDGNRLEWRYRRKRA